MSLYILLVFPEAQADQAGAIKAVLKFIPLFKETGGEVEIVKNVKAAWESLENRQYNYDLVIAHLHLPPDQQSPLDRSAQLGLGFLQDLSKHREHFSSILVAPTTDENLSQAVKLLPKCELILEGERLFDELSAKTQEYFESHKKKKKIIGNVDIWLNLHCQKHCTERVPGHYEMKIYEPGAGEKLVGSGPLWLDWKTLYDLGTKSRELENVDKYPWPNWREELEEVGESLRCEICEEQENFREHFKKLLKEVKNQIKNTRIRFKLTLGKGDSDPRAQFSEVLQAVVLEAMLDDQKKFLMLQAPIFRRLDLSVPADNGSGKYYQYKYQYPLFYQQANEEALKCLIIEADTFGPVPPELKIGQEKRYLKQLSHLREESQGLENFLKKRHNVLRLTKDRLPKKLSFQDWVAKILDQDGPWDLVHFAGHSLYAEDKTGYVFFPRENYAEPMNIENFSKLLRLAQVRFVYLSSCQSSEDDFVFQLANRGIPAILGFRWEIDDDKAKEYALKFYKYLIKNLSLEQAFLESRAYIHHKYEDNRIWASPLLILQSP